MADGWSVVWDEPGSLRLTSRPRLLGSMTVLRLSQTQFDCDKNVTLGQIRWPHLSTQQRSRFGRAMTPDQPRLSSLKQSEGENSPQRSKGSRGQGKPGLYEELERWLRTQVQLFVMHNCYDSYKDSNTLVQPLWAPGTPVGSTYKQASQTLIFIR